MNEGRDKVSFFVLRVYNTEKGTGKVLLVLTDEVSAFAHTIDGWSNYCSAEHYPGYSCCRINFHTKSIALIADVCNLAILGLCKSSNVVQNGISVRVQGVDHLATSDVDSDVISAG